MGYIEVLILPQRITEIYCLYGSPSSAWGVPEGCIRLGEPPSSASQGKGDHVLF